jgi:uncharacterized protein
LRSIDGVIRFSATDLTNFLACRHLTRLDRARAGGRLRPRVQRDLGFESIVARGDEHEASVLAEIRARGWDVVAMGDRFGDPALPADTLEALRSGVDVVYQGALQLANEGGYPDFLLRSDLLVDDAGERSTYEVVDAKLARTAKGRAVLQTAFYTRLLSAATGTSPNRMHLWLGHGEIVSFRVSDFAAYERQVSKLFHEFVAEDQGQVPPTDTYPDPAEHCQICRWRFDCTARRREDDDLSLIANIPAQQRKALKDVRILTMEAFADLQELPLLPRIGADSLRGTHLQASLQVASRRQGNAPLYELLEPERDAEDQLLPNRGFLGLPEPSSGDLFFDIEGARYYSEDATEFGLQYLFGIVDSAELDAEGQPIFRAFWAFDRASEGEAFEQLVDFVEERRRRDPGLHVFHYNHYEPTQIGHLSDLHQRREEVVGRLMGRFGTREDEVDDMFRQSIFVDLFKVVRQSLRASVESYSIKRLERFTGFERTVELEDANEHLIRFEAALDAGTARADLEGQRVVQGYNEDDCRSTLALRDWLEERRRELEARLGSTLPRLQPAITEAVVPDQVIEDLKRRLREVLPTDPEEWSDVHRARSLMADLLEWFRREDKPQWWRYFFLRGLEDEQLLLQRDAIAGLEYIDDDRTEKKTIISRYRFPEQEHSFEVGAALEDPTDEKGRKWKIDHIDRTPGELLLRRGPTLQSQPHPTSLIAPGPEFNTNSHRARLRDLAEELIRAGNGVPHTAAFDLLLRRKPSVGGGQAEGLRRDGETSLEAGVRLAGSLNGSYLPVQGPPGTGKTFTGASQILELVRQGRKVGVMALSHAAIGHMLNQIAVCARETDTPVQIGQKPKSDGTGLSAAVAATGTDYSKMNAGQIADDLASDVVDVVGGTSWLWSHEDCQGVLDTLVVDEAGQLSLAFVLSCAGAARNLILLGDPQQLAQPSQGTHPHGAGASSLEHVLGDRAVIDPTMGLLIEQTRRMHPDLTAFTSEAFYEGELSSLPELANQSVLRAGSLEGTGFRVVNVEHEANDNASREEADLVSEIARAAMDGRWLDSDGREQTIDPGDVLVVTPYNAQITEIGLAFESLGVGNVRVGTVDKFQGQEAPIVIYSTATSTAENAPRGMEFLYDLHRLNVATSRARCLVVLVTNPELVRVFCRTPRQMQLANALCRLRELATPV